MARRSHERSVEVHCQVAPRRRGEEATRCARHVVKAARDTRDRRGGRGRIDNGSSRIAFCEAKGEMANLVAMFQADYHMWENGNVASVDCPFPLFYLQLGVSIDRCLSLWFSCLFHPFAPINTTTIIIGVQSTRG